MNPWAMTLEWKLFKSDMNDGNDDFRFEKRQRGIYYMIQIILNWKIKQNTFEKTKNKTKKSKMKIQYMA